MISWTKLWNLPSTSKNFQFLEFCLVANFIIIISFSWLILADSLINIPLKFQSISCIVQIILCYKKASAQTWVITPFILSLIVLFATNFPPNHAKSVKQTNFQNHGYYYSIHLWILHISFINLLQSLLLGNRYIIKKPELMLTRKHM